MTVQRNARTLTPSSPTSGPTGSRAAPLPPPTGLLTGRAGRERSLAEAQVREEAGINRAQGFDWEDFNRRRFRLRAPGDQADVIILDATLDNLAWGYEHNMPSGQKYKDQRTGEDRDTYVCEVCPTETGLCPICQNGKRSSYMLYATILDLRMFHSERTNQDYDRFKRPIAIPSSLHPNYLQLFDAAMAQHNTIRGMTLLIERDHGQYAAACGRPVMIGSGSMFEMMTEAQLDEEFGHDAVYADPSDEERAAGQQNGRLVKPENFDITPYDYLRIFPKPDANLLRRKYGFGPVAGSRETDASWNAGQPQPAVNATSVPRTRSRTAVASQTPAPAQPAPVVSQPAAATVQATGRVRSRVAAPAAATAPAAGTVSRVRNAVQGATVTDADADIPFD